MAGLLNEWAGRLGLSRPLTALERDLSNGALLGEALVAVGAAPRDLLSQLVDKTSVCDIGRLPPPPPPLAHPRTAPALGLPAGACFSQLGSRARFRSQISCCVCLKPPWGRAGCCGLRGEGGSGFPLPHQQSSPCNTAYSGALSCKSQPCWACTSRACPSMCSICATEWRLGVYSCVALGAVPAGITYGAAPHQRTVHCTLPPTPPPSLSPPDPHTRNCRLVRFPYGGRDCSLLQRQRTSRLLPLTFAPLACR
jgi:hypothetical protein